ncbi:MAG: glycine--tRNA ligase subunit beta, partial [Pseudomonadales bacterium]|nr:glycine--tRNA ligase subunit beta [Pseudomonadales bacterium]
MATDTLLVEIGTEELPPKSLNRLRLSLAGGMKRQLNNADLSYTTLQCHATPRRLALIIEGLVDQQPDQAIERRGPAVKAAYDEGGDPSKALAGFMRACGIEDVTDLDTQKTEKGEWLVYRASRPGASLAEL